jgi:hypothetical protein
MPAGGGVLTLVGNLLGNETQGAIAVAVVQSRDEALQQAHAASPGGLRCPCIWRCFYPETGNLCES